MLHPCEQHTILLSALAEMNVDWIMGLKLRLVRVAHYGAFVNVRGFVMMVSK